MFADQIALGACQLFGAEPLSLQSLSNSVEHHFDGGSRLFRTRARYKRRSIRPPSLPCAWATPNRPRLALSRNSINKPAALAGQYSLHHLQGVACGIHDLQARKARERCGSAALTLARNTRFSCVRKLDRKKPALAFTRLKAANAASVSPASEFTEAQRRPRPPTSGPTCA